MNQEDRSTVRSKVSADGLFIFVLALSLIKGWDSETGGLAIKSVQCTCRNT